MRTLILSDVHANLTALDAVLADAEPFDQVWCLGDIVGYGPDPNECIERLSGLSGLHCIKGNHDSAILGEIDNRTFNDDARDSLLWLADVLTPYNLAWLSRLPEKLVLGQVTLVHGSPRNPIWEYIMDLRTARANMAAFDTPLCLVGHTHLPCACVSGDGASKPVSWVDVLPDHPYRFSAKSILNPGSVGQPRDHNPAASYLIYDEDREMPWQFRRVSYDVRSVQDRILAAGLPVRHALRLSEGW